MHGSVARRHRITPGAATASVVAALFVDEFERDAPLVSIPRAEIQLVVRFGPSAARGLDVHAFGARERAHRKVIRAGQRAVTARLHLGAQAAVLGAPATALAGRIVALEDLWGADATRQLLDRLAAARDAIEAVAIVERAIAERLVSIGPRCTLPDLAREAAARLASATVSDVAIGLGVSERHLRRVFRDAFGLSPKAFARLARFHRALRAARADRPASWARIAIDAGYYDQSHLIEEFRAIAGATPRALVDELGAGGRSESRPHATSFTR